MADVATTSTLSANFSTMLSFLSAAAGLGTAAMGLVDAAKAFAGGPSNFGFGYIETALKPFLVPAAGGATAFGTSEILRTLKANWLNGVPKTDQKAKAKALIHLVLTQGSAALLAAAAGVDAATLTSLARKTATGVPATADEINALGQFDAVLSAVLDAAYERADQQYRNACKVLATLVATVLGLVGGWFIYQPHFGFTQFVISFVVGISAAPLAPVAKDVASSLQAAVTAVGVIRRL
jgi:hypothetical protein